MLCLYFWDLCQRTHLRNFGIFWRIAKMNVGGINFSISLFRCLAQKNCHCKYLSGVLLIDSNWKQKYIFRTVLSNDPLSQQFLLELGLDLLPAAPPPPHAQPLPLPALLQRASAPPPLQPRHLLGLLPTLQTPPLLYRQYT